MSAQNLAISRRANALMNPGDWEALFELFDPQVEFRDLQHAPDLPETLQGVEGARLLAAQWIDAYDEFGAEIYEYIDADPWVVLDGRWHGRGKGSEVPVDVRQADAYEFKNGKIVRVIFGYQTAAAALEGVRRGG